MSKKRACGQWTYYGGAATCPHGYALHPDGTVEKLPLWQWRSHRRAIGKPLTVTDHQAHEV